MTKQLTVTDEQQKAIDEWLSDRPDSIKVMAKDYPPVYLYKLETTGSLVTLYSYSEDGTVTVTVSREFNMCLLQRHVFGIKLKDLTPICNVEDADEYRVKLPQSTFEILDHIEDEISEMIPVWHSEISEEIKGQDRAQLIQERLEAFIKQKLGELSHLDAVLESVVNTMNSQNN